MATGTFQLATALITHTLPAAHTFHILGGHARPVLLLLRIQGSRQLHGGGQKMRIETLQAGIRLAVRAENVALQTVAGLMLLQLGRLDGRTARLLEIARLTYNALCSVICVKRKVAFLHLPDKNKQ